MLDFKQKLDQVKGVVSTRMQQVTSQEKPVTLYEPMRYAIQGGGKLLRPCLLMLAAEVFDAPVQSSTDAAVALEMIHNFTLIHDDIMDHDDLRRGRPTVHTKWDESVAILAGDGLQVLAYLTLGKIHTDRLGDIITCFSDGILKVCEGQALDKEYENRRSISLNEYFEMIDNKTGKLFSIACEIGALLGNAGQKEIAAMRKYGRMVGRAFQIQDDVLDVVSDQSVLGKNFASDLYERKKTFLVAHVQSTKFAREFSEIFEKSKIHDYDVKELIGLFFTAGAIPAAKSEIVNSLKNAHSALKNVPNHPSLEYLSELLVIIEERNF